MNGSLPDTAVALRRIRRDEAYTNGAVKKAAFMPRKNGKDRDGLSVSIEDPGLAEIHRAKFERENCRAVSLRVAAARAISLDVVRRPMADGPGHALVTGVPDPNMDRLGAERCAEQLARAATPVHVPSLRPKEQRGGLPSRRAPSPLKTRTAPAPDRSASPR